MDKGFSTTTKYLLRYLEDEKEEIDSYVKRNLQHSYYEFQTKEEIDEIFAATIHDFLKSISFEEEQDLKAYTGYQFRNINAILRNKWNYEAKEYLLKIKKKNICY